MPAPAHIVRLRGPWEYCPLFRIVIMSDGSRRRETGDLPPPGRIVLPADWSSPLGADFRGRVAYRRRFGCPTGLGDADCVDLVLDRVDADGQAMLNGEILGDIGAAEHAWRREITSLLRPRNDLVVEVELPGHAGLPRGLVGEVRLEIFAASA